MGFSRNAIFMYEIRINDKVFTIEPGKDNTGKVNDLPFSLDIIRLDDRNLHIIREHKSYNVEIITFDRDSNTIVLRINGRKYQLVVKDRFDLLLEQLGFSRTSGRAMGDLKAPMPGLVLRIEVEPGQEVAKGDPLIVLEAMKMENVIKAAAEGVVKSIETEPGQAVEKNEILIKF